MEPGGSSAVLALAVGGGPSAAEVLFEEMLAGWARQQASRRLSASFVASRLQVVRRFAEFTQCYPWAWSPAQLESWVAASRWAHSTVRLYQQALAAFGEYLADERYGWPATCLARVGAAPVRLCYPDNTVRHVADYEGRPARRPLSRVELQALFDAADERVRRTAAAGRKGWLPAFRDAVLFKVVYAFGLRRAEAVMLDVTDFTANPAAPSLEGYGFCHVRFGKAMRGSPPRRRTVATVMPWSAQVLAQYVAEVRPAFRGAAGSPLWLTERGGRISVHAVNERFGLLRAAAGLPAGLSMHCLRHSYVSHLVEDGVDPVFVQAQVGHAWAATTAVYTSVGSDVKNRMLADALARAFAADGAQGRLG